MSLRVDANLLDSTIADQHEGLQVMFSELENANCALAGDKPDAYRANVAVQHCLWIWGVLHDYNRQLRGAIDAASKEGRAGLREERQAEVDRLRRELADAERNLGFVTDD